jgi:hypothetical protein
MEFQLEDGTVFPSPNRATVEHWLQQLAPNTANTFAVLDIYGAITGPEYIQVACDGSGFVIEKREGEPPHHYRAVRETSGWSLLGRKSGDPIFSMDEAIEAVCAFGFGEVRTPNFIRWQNMDSEVGLG